MAKEQDTNLLMPQKTEPASQPTLSWRPKKAPGWLTPAETVSPQGLTSQPRVTSAF